MKVKRLPEGETGQKGRLKGTEILTQLSRAPRHQACPCMVYTILTLGLGLGRTHVGSPAAVIAGS
jgi:hypothetical protein